MTWDSISRRKSLNVEEVAHWSELQQQVSEYKDVITLWELSHGAQRQEWDGSEEKLARVGLRLDNVIKEKDHLMKALLTNKQGHVCGCAVSLKP